MTLPFDIETYRDRNLPGRRAAEFTCPENEYPEISEVLREPGWIERAHPIIAGGQVSASWERTTD